MTFANQPAFVVRGVEFFRLDDDEDGQPRYKASFPKGDSLPLASIVIERLYENSSLFGVIVLNDKVYEAGNAHDNVVDAATEGLDRIVELFGQIAREAKGDHEHLL